MHGWALSAAIIGVAVVTAASFFLNAMFAFVIAKPGRPQIRPAFAQARSHAGIVLSAGSVVGLLVGGRLCTRTAGGEDGSPSP